MEKHAKINSTYFRKAKIVIFVYDITDRETFDSLTRWEHEAVEKNFDTVKSTVTILVGNKLDLEDNREVTRSRALVFAENYRIPENLIFEISAKTGEGVSALSDAIAQQMMSIGSKPRKKSSKPRKQSSSCPC